VKLHAFVVVDKDIA